MSTAAPRRPERIPGLEGAGAPELGRVAGAILAGEVIALLTETIWGLSADPFSDEAMARISFLKGRRRERGFLCLVPSVESMPSLGVILDRGTLAALGELWPAPVTVIFPSAHPPAASGGLSTVAVRVPPAGPLLRLLSATGPLASTSANVEGAAPATTADEVERTFGAGIAWIVGDRCASDARPSTLVDAAVTPPRIVRSGSGAAEAREFLRAIGGYAETL